MKTIPEKLLSAIVMVTAVFVMAGWLTNQQGLKAFNPNFIVMVFNTALSFFATGGAILLPESKPGLRKKGQCCVGWAVLLFAALTLLQDVSGTSFGIDQLFATVVIDDYNPHPGRMAPPTALSFMLCGIILILLNSRKTRAASIIIQASTICMMTLAILGVAGASVRLELLYDWYKYGRMALPTALDFLLLAAALWITWYRQEIRDGVYLKKEEKRISVTGIVIISVVALSAGMSGFGILANQMEHTLELSLRETHNNHTRLVQSEIELGISQSSPVATRLLLNRFLAAFDVDPTVAGGREVIHEDAASLLSQNFDGIAIYSRSGELVTRVGQFAENPDLSFRLHTDDPARQVFLLWKSGPVLRTVLDIAPNDVKIGRAIVERKLPYFEKMLHEKGFLGETAETRICYALDADMMQCLPNRRHPELFPAEPRANAQDITSMHFALLGETGIRVFHDYLNHQVVSAYGPVGNFGLGLVVKIDTAEFYGPIRERLQYAVGLIFLLSGIGIFLQSLQLVPLVKRLVESEERVNSVNRFQQALLDSTNFTIIACDTKGIIKIFNKSAERMLGYSAEEVIGKMTPGVFHDRELIRKRSEELSAELGYEIKPGFETFIAKARFSGSDEREWVYIRRDGTSYPVLLSVSCLRNEAGEVTGSLGIGIDITERKRLERLKNEFISTVSHELRTPLTSIRGSLGLMRAGVVGEMAPKAKEMTEIAYNNAERLILLINDILDIDKIESGEIRFDIKEHDLASLVSQAVQANQAYGEKFGVRFVIEPSASAALVAVDANRLIQVLSNLLSNAAKFSEPGDEVRVAMTLKETSVRIAVIDKGPGIPEAFRTRIFSKFAQADSSSSRQKGGTGLGLNISKQIIEHMGGRIGFDSKVGKGSTFWIELPEIAKQSQSEALHEIIEYLNTNNITHLPRILHAENDYDLCRIIAHSLQGKALVHIAASVADASELLKSHAYDLLILDIGLPDGSGLRLLNQLRADNQPTRVMILSASEVDETVRSKVALALVKSKVSEDRIIEYILSLIGDSHAFNRKD